MTSRSPSVHLHPQRLTRQFSVGSRRSLALSAEEEGEAAPNADENKIDEEIESIRKYEDFTTIDWVQDAAREQLRRKVRRRETKGFFERGGRKGWRLRIWETYDAAQAWIVVTIIGRWRWEGTGSVC